VVFGLVAALVMGSSHYDLISILIVIALPAALLLPGVLRTIIRGGRSLFQGFTWWQGIWTILFLSGLVFRDRGIQEIEGEAIDGWALFRLALVALAAMVLLVRVALRKSDWPRYLLRGLIAWLSAYSIICLISTLWSVFPSWTLYKSCEYLVDIAALAAVMAAARNAQSYKRLFNWTWCLLGLLLLSVWIGLLVRPQDALTPIWREQRMAAGLFSVQLSGVMPQLNGNAVGELGALVGVVAICRLLRKQREDRAWYWFLLLVALITMCFAQARSGILGFVVGVALVMIFSGRLKMGLLMLAAFAAILIASGSAWGIFSDFMRRGESDEELYSLSSRVDWWSLAWPKILDRPFTGYGAFAGARFFVLSESGLDVSSIHSDWVETLVGTGLCGLIPALAVLVGTCRALVRSIRGAGLSLLERELRVEAIGALGVISIRSIFTNDLFWHPPLVFFAVLAYAQLMTARRRRHSANQVLAQATLEPSR
jgi:O-antigen ligase